MSLYRFPWRPSLLLRRHDGDEITNDGIRVLSTSFHFKPEECGTVQRFLLHFYTDKKLTGKNLHFFAFVLGRVPHHRRGRFVSVQAGKT
jgi:hypothetical protein